MRSHIEVTFHGLPRDDSLEAAIDRWVARLEAMRVEIETAVVIVEKSGRQTCVAVALALASGVSSSAVCAHADPYVAVSNAFRGARREAVGGAATTAELQLTRA